MDSSAEQRRFWDQDAKSWDPSAAIETTETAPMLDFLAGLAGDGPALEFAIGTGRIAVPLHRRGVRMSGLDVSPGMLEVLHATVPAAELPATVGSMATADGPERDNRLVYIVANALSCLLHQDEQVACFRNAARHLRPGGHLVVSLWIPQLRQLPLGQSHVVGSVTDTSWIVDRYDLVDQRVVSYHFGVDGDDVTGSGHGTRHRYAWPSELDLMARLAGVEFVARYADWQRGPFTAESTMGISVWRRPRTGEADEPRALGDGGDVPGQTGLRSPSKPG